MLTHLRPDSPHNVDPQIGFMVAIFWLATSVTQDLSFVDDCEINTDIVRNVTLLQVRNCAKISATSSLPNHVQRLTSSSPFP